MTNKELKELMAKMSLEEKAGQLLQVNAELLGGQQVETGPITSCFCKEDICLAGSVLNVSGAARMKQIQREFMDKHPHKIPLLFMADVINGYKTIFPIPLAQSCTFDTKLVEQCAEASAKEATSAGIQVNFSPMLDLTRDPRWGRVMEGYGEDSCLLCSMAHAVVKGYQGTSYEKEGSMVSCFKHFAGYGAPVAGRDYNQVELCERTLREDYMVGYQAAIKAGADMVMTAFNTLNRIPASANKKLLRDILREEMEFQGIVISDWAAIEELLAHGVAKDREEAARLAIEAGVDIDMVTNIYIVNLPRMIREALVEERLLDEAVLRVLKLKNRLGLFENPYRFADEKREREICGCEENRYLAKKMAEESFVLLKNESILPLDKKNKKICFIGPFLEEKKITGAWSFLVKQENVKTVRKAVEEILEDGIFSKGCEILNRGIRLRHFAGKMEEASNLTTEQEEEARYRDAENVAAQADVVVMLLGEHSYESGEAASRTELEIHELQMELFRRIYRVNPNIAVVIFSGRPLIISEICDKAKAVLMAWMPGTEGADALAAVLFGDAQPSGRLSMSIPRNVGQIPIFYKQLSTGRPCCEWNPLDRSCSKYIDIPNTPLFPFGYGKTYTSFEYSEISLSDKELMNDKFLTASVIVTNVGKQIGVEVVQMYIQDIAGSVARPVRELKGFCRVELQPGESRQVSFTITEEMLRFYDINMEYRSEPGKFRIWIGPDSITYNGTEFELKH